MSLTELQGEHFRCLGTVRIQPDPALNLITGPNAAGKTSLLESIFFLSRGRSFRGTRSAELIQHDAQALKLSASVSNGLQHHRLSTEVDRTGRRMQIDGTVSTAGDMAAVLPVQVVGPEIHQLIQGGPEQRRRFLDWGVFHVEPAFLDTWRRYQRALRQRNAALRRGEPRATIVAWDGELADAGEQVHSMRHAFAKQFFAQLSSIIAEMFPFNLKSSYFRGWKEPESLASALSDNWSRDLGAQATQLGPHRADLRFEFGGRRLRHQLSRGQQKLLGAALVIAQTHFVVEARQCEIVLLVDEPAAELDADYRKRLFELLRTVPAQMFVAALEPADLPLADAGRRFHVEHGEVVALV